MRLDADAFGAQRWTILDTIRRRAGVRGGQCASADRGPRYASAFHPTAEEAAWPAEVS